MKKKLFQDTTGIIMMETIFMLPIYLVMLASIFWLGEICLSHLTLNHGERLRLWEHSTRYITAHDFIDFSGPEGIFWFAPNTSGTRDAMVTGVSLASQNFPGVETTDGWGQIHTGNMQINTRRSNWSWGISSFSRRDLWNNNKEYPFDIDGADIWQMSARTRDSNTLNSCMLSRKEYTGGDKFFRENDKAYNNSTNWIEIARSCWSDFIVPQISAPGTHSIAPHSRLYEQWSE